MYWSAEKIEYMVPEFISIARTMHKFLNRSKQKKRIKVRMMNEYIKINFAKLFLTVNIQPE